MTIFSYHLVRFSFFQSIKCLIFGLSPTKTPGLIHAETMTCMTLGASIISPKRFLLRQVAVFAQWENEDSLNDFLKNNKTGQQLNLGWYLKLRYMRQWGSFRGFKIPEEGFKNENPEAPIVAVTIARMKMTQIPRFIHWGRPVEKLVRDHKGTTLSLASIRLPKTVSTFSIWKNQREMLEMVHGKSKMQQPKRHAAAMKERERKNFHSEFTTLRFTCIGEYGSWQGKNNYIPNFS